MKNYKEGHWLLTKNSAVSIPSWLLLRERNYNYFNVKYSPDIVVILFVSKKIIIKKLPKCNFFKFCHYNWNIYYRSNSVKKLSTDIKNRKLLKSSSLINLTSSFWKNFS